ncbi:sulfurtransferase TusA family protein, partial [Desulfovibrio sp.]
MNRRIFMEQLDCRGLACPQPVMRTRDAL